MPLTEILFWCVAPFPFALIAYMAWPRNEKCPTCDSRDTSVDTNVGWWCNECHEAARFYEVIDITKAPLPPPLREFKDYAETSKSKAFHAAYKKYIIEFHEALLK